MDFGSRPLRSVLFLPASNPRAVEKAHTLPCDAVVLDLEDAVAPDAKDGARAAIAEAGDFGRRLLAVRVNPLEGRWGAQDFAVASSSAADVIVVPKVDSVAQANAAVAAGKGKPIVAMIESPAAVLAAASIAAVEGIAGLLVGANDLAKELRATSGRDRAPLLYALSAVVIAARAAGKVALDGVHNAITDLDALKLTSEQGAALGFDGRSLIHPSHIEIANAAYSPSEAALADARALVEAYEAAGGGVTTAKGKMIEALHVEEAQRLIAFAEAISR